MCCSGVLPPAQSPVCPPLPCVVAASWAGCPPACKGAMQSPGEWNIHSHSTPPPSQNPPGVAERTVSLGRFPSASPQRTPPGSGRPLPPLNRADGTGEQKVWPGPTSPSPPAPSHAILTAKDLAGPSCPFILGCLQPGILSQGSE